MSEGLYITAHQSPREKTHYYTDAFHTDEDVYHVRAQYENTTLLDVHCPEELIPAVLGLAMDLKERLGLSILMAEQEWQRKEQEREALEGADTVDE